MVRQALGSLLTLGGSCVMVQVISEQPAMPMFEEGLGNAKDDIRRRSEAIWASRNSPRAMRPDIMMHNSTPNAKGESDLPIPLTKGTALHMRDVAETIWPSTFW